MSLSKLQPLINIHYDLVTMVDPSFDALLLRIFQLSGVTLRDWQKGAVYCLLKKNDLIVKAGTGAGKSWVFWSMALSQRDGIVLVIAPLKAIMNNHHMKLQKLGLSAVIMTSESVEKDPGIWNRMDQGVYRIVYATPEILLRPTSHFLKKTMRSENAFKRRLCLIAIDEAHTLHDYRGFRRSFGKIGKLRSLLPDVPQVALSATIAPPVANYVRRHSNMKNPSYLITVNGRRKNIDLLVKEQYGRECFDQLLEIIPIDDSAIQDIPQTLIFVDRVEMAKRIAVALRGRLPKADGIKPYQLIRTYYSSIDEKKKTETQRLVNDGRARIVVCTDSMSMGVDFPEIERVIQWGVDEKLTLGVLSQRIGRAAREEDTQGVAIIYVPFELLKSGDKTWLEAWNSDVAGVLLSGEARKLKAADRNALLALPVSPETEANVSTLLEYLWRQAEIDAESPRNSNGTTGAHAIDLPLLWFLCNVGCRHKCLMAYLGYDDELYDNTQRSWCCDNCAIALGDYEELITAGFGPKSSIRLQDESKKPKSTQPRPKLLPAHVTECVDRVKKDVTEWRGILFEKLVSRNRICKDMPPEVVLPTKAIEAILKAIRRISSIDSLKDVLHSAHFRCQESLLRQKDIEELYIIVSDAVQDQGTPLVIVLT